MWKVRLPLIDVSSSFYSSKLFQIGEWLMPVKKCSPICRSLLAIPIKNAEGTEVCQQADYYDFVFGASTIHVAYKPLLPKEAIMELEQQFTSVLAEIEVDGKASDRNRDCS